MKVDQKFLEFTRQNYPAIYREYCEQIKHIEKQERRRDNLADWRKAKDRRRVAGIKGDTQRELQQRGFSKAYRLSKDATIEGCQLEIAWLESDISKLTPRQSRRIQFLKDSIKVLSGDSRLTVKKNEVETSQNVSAINAASGIEGQGAN